jgi:hypothetical protein
MHLYFFFFDTPAPGPAPVSESNSGGWWWYRKEEEKKKKKEEVQAAKVQRVVEVLKYTKSDLFISPEQLRKVGTVPQVQTEPAVSTLAPPAFVPGVVEKKRTRRLREDEELLLFF